MYRTRRLTPILILMTVTGCATDPLPEDESPSLMQNMARFVTRAASESLSVDRCADRNTDVRVSRREAETVCRSQFQAARQEQQARERVEAAQQKAAIELAFAERDSYKDTAATILEQVDERWIDQAHEPRSMVKREDWLDLKD